MLVGSEDGSIRFVICSEINYYKLTEEIIYCLQVYNKNDTNKSDYVQAAQH